MSDVSEEEWKSDLTSILEELDKTQYFRMLECLGKIPGGKKKKKKKDIQMPGMIIEYYGLLDSILAIGDAMQKIPRNDSKIQNLLRRHVEQARSKLEDDNQGKKRKREEEDSVLTHVTTNHIPNQQKSSQADNERSATATWRKSIRDLKSSEILETDGFIGKVVQKSGLRPYHNKENKNKCFFYLGVADDMASVKVKVYGKDRYEELREGISYLFSRLLIEENVVTVTSLSKVSYTKAVVVPEDLKQEASELISPESPAFSIQEAKSSPNKTRGTVEGTVTEIDPLNKVTVNYKRQKVKQQRFRLRDETGSIWIVMWDEAAVGFCCGLSVGDTVRLSNMKTNEYFGDVSLNSTVNTKLIKLQSVSVQKVRIQIIGIKKATKKETQLEAEVHQQLHTFVVATPLLAKTFGLKATGDFRESLLEAMPLAADTEIQGNKITTITAASKTCRDSSCSFNNVVPSEVAQTGTIKIIGIKSSNTRNTHLEVEFNGRLQTLYMTTRLLADAFGLKAEPGFTEAFSRRMPLIADAKIKGNKITEIKNV